MEKQNMPTSPSCCEARPQFYLVSINSIKSLSLIQKAILYTCSQFINVLEGKGKAIPVTGHEGPYGC
jgi:hypothetical protein